MEIRDSRPKPTQADKTGSTYKDALSALQDRTVFNGDGVARWPHHEFIFLYPHLDLLPPTTEVCVPQPLNHAKRKEPAGDGVQSWSSSFHSLSLVDTTTHRGRAPIDKKNLAKAIDSQSRTEGTTLVKMVTYKPKQVSKDPMLDYLPPLFRVSVQHISQRTVEAGVSSYYDFTLEEFYQLHGHGGCDATCKHWWHNLEELFLRSNDRAYLEVQQYVDRQDSTLPVVDWDTSQAPQLPSAWQEIEEKYEHYFTTPLSDMTDYEQDNPSQPPVTLDDKGILSRSTKAQSDKSRYKNKIGRSEIILDKIQIDRNEMVQGVSHLLRLCRATHAAPYRLAPEFTDEADVMQQVLERFISVTNGWQYWPRDLANLMMKEVLGALAETSEPPFQLDDNDGNYGNPNNQQVQLTPGFTEFLGRFINGLVNWCRDAERENTNFFFDKSEGPVKYWEDELEELNRSGKWKGKAVRAPVTLQRRRSRRQSDMQREKLKAEDQDDEASNDVDMEDYDA